MGHFSKCPNAYYTCIDCSTTFDGDEFKSHTTCITEKEKYEKGYGKKQQQQNKNANSTAIINKEDKKKGHKVTRKNEANSDNELVPRGKALEFSKVLKQLKKKHNKKRKELLKSMTLEKNTNGELVLNIPSNP